MASSKRVAIIGAGPIGIEAALRAKEEGWAVTVFEKECVGAHLLKWGHIRLFTALKDSVSPLLQSYLPPSTDLSRYLTGREFVVTVLEPIVRTVFNKGAIHEGWAVRGIARRRIFKTELPGHPLRGDRPFQLFIASNTGEEKIVEADVVLDAGGVYGTANWSGESGLPCPGERDAAKNIVRHLPDIKGADLENWVGRRILLIGDGHSAATAYRWFTELYAENPRTQIHWVVNTDRARPCLEVADDPLPERRQTVEMANHFAENPPAGWRVYRKSALLHLKSHDGSMWTAEVGRGDNKTQILVDKILSLTGYRPDNSYLEDLQVQLSPVTTGAERLASSLLKITDCLSPITVPKESLSSGEKGFFLVGHKSYGRLNTFLLRSGVEQLDQIFKLIKTS